MGGPGSSGERIVLDELDSVGVERRLHGDAAAAFARSGLLDVRPLGGGRFRLVPIGRVGAVRVGAVQVEVAPKGKIGIDRVFFLLGYARDPGFTADDFLAEEDSELFSAMAEALARQSRRAIAGGLHHGYVSVDEAARTLRGRVRLGDQMSRRPGVWMPIEVSYDEWSADIAENRILRSAVRRVAQIRGIPESTRRDLVAVDARLDPARVLVHGESIPPWNPTRLNERYQPALRLAELVLRTMSFDTGVGRLDAASFVVPMWKVYEDFVATALTEALKAYPGSTREQFPARLDRPQHGQAGINMDVDIVHSVGGRAVIVADAKYKAEAGTGRYANADKYQMLAYCTALGIRRAWLVYAQGGAPVVRRVANSEVEIVDWPLDLSRSPRDILGQVRELADAMGADAGLVSLQ